MRDTDAKKFFASLIKEICNDQNTDAQRQMACVIGKNLISNRSGDSRYTELWSSFEDQFRQSMKEAILAQLVCPSQVVRTQIASFVSAIAAIEIPQGKWYDLIDNLCSNAGNMNAQVKHTSL